MLQDGLIFADGSVATNLQIDHATTLPTVGGQTGEIFYLTAVSGSNGPGLYVYTGSAWTAVNPLQTYAITGDVTGTVGGSNVLSLPAVNSNVGTYGSSTLIPIITTDAKGRITSVSTASVTGFNAASNQTITGTWSFTNPVAGVAPTDDSHFVTKAYADSVASGLDPKNAVRVATTANITLSGLQTIDGVSVAAGDRVLVKNQTLGANNGIYVAASGAWTRSTDFDGSPASEVTSGAYTFVTNGTTQAATGFVLVTADPITIGTTAQSWTQFNSASTTTATLAATTTIGSGAASTLSAGNQFTIQAGPGGSIAASTLSLYGGTSNSGSVGGGNVVIAPGGNVTAGSGIGNVTIQGAPVGSYSGAAGGSNNGAIKFLVAPNGGNSGAPTLINTLSFLAGGAWSVNGDTGTSGYVLATTGSGTPPAWVAAPSGLPTQTGNSGKYLTTDGTTATWGTVAGGSGAASALTGTTLASNVVNSSLTSLGTIAALSATNITLTGTLTTGGSTGSTGQVLTSNGTGAPTWQAASAGGSLAATTTIGTGAANATFGTVAGAKTTLTIQAAANPSSGTTDASLYLLAGSSGSSSLSGGSVFIVPGANTAAAGSGLGNVVLQGNPSGTYTGATTVNNGAIMFQTGAIASTSASTNALVTRLTIQPGGAWGLGATNAVGTSGQVLTSAGAGAPPTWSTIAATNATNLTGGVAGAIHYQSAVSTSAFTAPATATGQFLLSGGGGTGAPTWSSNSAGSSILYTAGSGSTPSIMSFGDDLNRGIKIVTPAVGSNNATGMPDIFIIAGNGNSGVANSGNIYLQAGLASGTTSGNIVMSTGLSTGSLTEKVRINESGAIALNGSSNWGTAGQALVSNGSGSAVTWSSTLTGTLAGVTATPFHYNGAIVPTQISTFGVYIGAGATPGGSLDGTANITFVNTAGSGSNSRLAAIYTDATAMYFNFNADSLGSGTSWLKATRNTTDGTGKAPLVTFTASSVTFSDTVTSGGNYSGPNNVNYTSAGNATFTSTGTTNLTGYGTNSVQVTTPTQASGNTGAINIQTGAATSGNGANITIIGGNGANGGGSVNITAGSITSSGSGPGDINLTTGSNAGGRGGNVQISASTGTTAGGTLTFNSGAASAAANGADITFNTGNGTTQRGSININAFSLIVNAPIIATTHTSTGGVTLQSAVGQNDVTIKSQANTTATGAILSSTGNATTSGDTGRFNFTTGNATSGNSGAFTFATGSGTSSSGGMAHTIGSASAGPSGAFTVSIGSGSTNGGQISLVAGNGSGGTGGTFTINAGNGSTTGGPVNIYSGSGGTGAAGNILLQASTSGSTAGAISLAANTVNVGNSGASINFGSGAILFSGTGGNTSAPTMIIGSTSNSHPPIIQSPAGTAYGLTIQQGDWSSTSGTPPSLVVRGSDNSGAGGNGGALNLRAGNSASGAPGNASMNAGNAQGGTGNGGTAFVAAGSSAGGVGGDVSVIPGTGSTGNGSVLLGTGAAVANAATGGFVYIPVVNGTPTGVPTAHAGMVAMVFDYSTGKIWIYNGAWKSTPALT